MLQVYYNIMILSVSDNGMKLNYRRAPVFNIKYFNKHEQ